MIKKNNLFCIVLFILSLNPSKNFAQQDKNLKDTISFDVAKARAQSFINKILIQGGDTVKVKDISEMGDFYKLIVTNKGQEVTSYMTKDGKMLFPNGMDIDSETQKYIDARTPVKSDKPVVELFVMSYCPFGTQIERGILPVVDALGDKIDFELKFCSYAMHEKKELTEELREYCLHKQKPKLFNNYLNCFLEEGKSNECLAKVGIDSVKMDRDIAAVDTEYKVTDMYNDKSKWFNGNYPYFNIYKDDNEKYKVQGSPTLVLNGKTMQAGRDPESMLQLICSAFNNPPEACSKVKLSSTVPAPGFAIAENAPPANNNGACVPAKEPGKSPNCPAK